MHANHSQIPLPFGRLQTLETCVALEAPWAGVTQGSHWAGGQFTVSLDAGVCVCATQPQGKDHVGAGGALIHGRGTHSPLAHCLPQQGGHCFRPAHIQGLCKCDAGPPILIMGHLHPHITGSACLSLLNVALMRSQQWAQDKLAPVLMAA